MDGLKHVLGVNFHDQSKDAMADRPADAVAGRLPLFPKSGGL